MSKNLSSFPSTAEDNFEKRRKIICWVSSKFNLNIVYLPSSLQSCKLCGPRDLAPQGLTRLHNQPLPGCIPSYATALSLFFRMLSICFYRFLKEGILAVVTKINVPRLYASSWGLRSPSSHPWERDAVHLFVLRPQKKMFGSPRGPWLRGGTGGLPIRSRRLLYCLLRFCSCSP